jgi:D-amino-acid dehydrogenase
VRIVVLGGGVVGVAAAYYLSNDGHEVTLVDRNALPASETSYGNAGLVSPGDSYAWASPGALKMFVKSLVRSDLGIKVRPSLDPYFLLWTWQFLFQCTPARAHINTLRKLRIAMYSKDCINALAQRTGVQYDSSQRGILYFYRSQQSLDAGAQHMKILADHGLSIEIVGRDRLVALDPGLSAAKDRIAGAVYSPMDQTGDSCLFARNLTAWCEQRGNVRFRYGVTVRNLNIEGGRVTSVGTDQGTIEADAFVIAMGAESALLGRTVGLELPIYPVKGYSMTVPIRNGGPTLGGVDEDKLIAYSRLGNRLRLACKAEFAGYDRSHKPQDFKMLRTVGEELFPGVAEFDKAEYWAGLRPMTPTSVPILGRARYDNLYLDCGHGHVGWTMACGSGRFVADIIAGRKPEIDTDGLLYEH